METEAKQLPDLEVVVTCTKCRMPHTPHNTDQFGSHCVQCEARVDWKGHSEMNEFFLSLDALLAEVSKTTALSHALQTATDKLKAAQTVFAISIRARKTN